MARRKKLTLEEEIVQLEQGIAEVENQINELTEKKKGLKEFLGKKQLEALHQAVLHSGKTIEEAINLIGADGHGEM